MTSYDITGKIMLSFIEGRHQVDSVVYAGILETDGTTLWWIDPAGVRHESTTMASAVVAFVARGCLKLRPPQHKAAEHMDECFKLRVELADARAWIERLQRTTQTLTCVYCGQEYPPGTPTHGSEMLTAHIRVCEKHPMRAAEAEAQMLREALVGLVGADGEADLDALEGSVGDPAMYSAIAALRNTLPQSGVDGMSPMHQQEDF